MTIALAHFEDRSGDERKLRVLIGGSGLSTIVLIALTVSLLSGQG